MKREIIAIDIDDVLAASNRAVLKFANKYFGSNYSWEEYSQFRAPYKDYWRTVWDRSQKEIDQFYEKFMAEYGHSSLVVEEGAIKTIQHLKQRFDLVIVTGRRDEHREDTHHWLDKHFPRTFRHVKFAPIWGDNNHRTKAALCQELGAKYLIDDALEHCLLAAEAGVTALLFGNYGWNQADELPGSMTRVKDWPDVRGYFDDKG